MPNSKTALLPQGQFRQILTTPEHRRYITVGRQDYVDDTLEQLAGSASRQSKHHFLFIGTRGIGKSHLLSLIEDGISRDSKLAKSYVIARFPEESHRTLSFADFLLGLVDILKEELPDEPEWAQLYEQYHTEKENTRVVDALVPVIRRANSEKQRTVLVMLENLNELFTRQIKDKKEVAAFRKFFMDANGCLLIATSPLHFAAITSVDEPFYDFFDTQLLEHLSQAQTIELVRKNLEWEKSTLSKKLLKDFDSVLKPKIYALYRLTAGNPRLTVMLYELITHDSITEVRQQLEVLLDRVTPFYQDRLNDLPPQERAVLETMARMRDMAKTPAAITERLRIPQNQTSTLLKRLSDAHYIFSSANPADKRSRIYAIRERFFDIWLVMNVSRAAQKRIPYLLDFFALVYPELEERNCKRAELSAKNDSNAVESLGYLSEIGKVDEKRSAKYGLAKKLSSAGKKDDAQVYLRESYELDGKNRYENYLDDIEQMIECWDLHRDGNLEAFASKLSEMSEGLTYKSWSETKILFLKEQLTHLEKPEDRIMIQVRIASLLSDLARWDQAEKLLRGALAESEQSKKQKSLVLNDLAQILKETNRIKDAEPLMREALKIDKITFGDDHPIVAVGLNNLAQLLKDFNRINEAESLMREALKIDKTALGDDHPTVAIRLNNLAQLLQDTNRTNQAEPFMRKALKIDKTAFGDEHPKVATSLNNLALLLKKTNRINAAEPLMREALIIDKTAFGDNHPTVAIRLNNLAQILKETNRIEEAEPLMREALIIDKTAFGDNHPTVAIRLNNLAHLLKETNRIEEAEPLMCRALEILSHYKSDAGFTHPSYKIFYENYRSLLQDMELAEDKIQAALARFENNET